MNNLSLYGKLYFFLNQKVRLKIDATFALQNTLNIYEQIISGADMYQRLT